MTELSSIEQTIISEIHKRATPNKPFLVALDGRSGVGKSTIAERLGKELNATIVDADKFYSGGDDAYWDKRAAEQKVAEVIDWRRLKSEVLEPLLAGKTAEYHPFDFKNWSGLSEELITLQPSDIIILDGAYSSRPELSDIIDLSVLIEVPDDLNRRQRLIKREGESYMSNWHSHWDSAEDYYFTKIRPSSSFDLKVTSE